MTGYRPVDPEISGTVIMLDKTPCPALGTPEYTRLRGPFTFNDYATMGAQDIDVPLVKPRPGEVSLRVDR